MKHVTWRRLLANFLCNANTLTYPIILYHIQKTMVYICPFNWDKIYPLYSMRISCVKYFNHQVEDEKSLMDQIHMNELFLGVTCLIMALILLCLWMYFIFEACTRVEARSDDILQHAFNSQGMYKTFFSREYLDIISI